ncbi:MAG: hypothetical protein ABWY27_03680 [Telluria sp.]
MLSLKQAWERWRNWVLESRRERNRAGQEAILRNRVTQRSLSLLMALLNEEQRREFQVYGYFHVTGGSSGDTYRIRRDTAVNIDVLGHNGTVRYHLCAHPMGNIPMYDVMAGQLLYLQDPASETRFLEQAIRHVTLSFAAMGRWQER